MCMTVAPRLESLAHMMRLGCAVCQTDIGEDQPMAVAHMTPPVRSVTPAMKIAVSARVRIQLLRMVVAPIAGMPRGRMASKKLMNS